MQINQQNLSASNQDAVLAFNSRVAAGRKFATGRVNIRGVAITEEGSADGTSSRNITDGINKSGIETGYHGSHLQNNDDVLTTHSKQTINQPEPDPLDDSASSVEKETLDVNMHKEPLKPLRKEGKISLSLQ